MKRAEKVSILIWIILHGATVCSGILTGTDQLREDITTVRKYGCSWQGGSNAMVSCTCMEDADEFYIRRGEIPVYDTWAIEISSCRNVIFGENSIEDLRNLRSIQLNNISSLNLLPNSLSWFGYRATYHVDDEEDDENIPALKIVIENTLITKISQNTFKGRIREIEILNCVIKEVDSFAFTSLVQSHVVALKYSTVDVLKPQAFKSFTTKQLILDKLAIDTLPSRTFSNLVVADRLILTNSKIRNLNSGAFIVEGTKWLEVSHCNLSTLEGEAFQVNVKGDVLFRNNFISVVNYGSFIKIKPSSDSTTSVAHYLTLDSNYFGWLGKNSLEVEGMIMKLVNLKLNETCNCNGMYANFDKFKEFYTEIKCADDGKYVSLKDYKSDQCTILSGHTTTIVVSGVVCTLILIMIVILSLYYHRAYREGKYGNKNEPTKNMSLIVPDGRTYRETEVHVILETADLLTTDL